MVISDTHFGAWTGRDLLREDFFLERLAPALDGVDEVILLGDLFDFLFGSVADAVDSSAGLLKLIGEKLPGKRFVFLSGNHDHHLVHRDEENQLEVKLVTTMLLQKLRADALPGRTMTVRQMPTLSPRGGLRMRLAARA